MSRSSICFCYCPSTTVDSHCAKCMWQAQRSSGLPVCLSDCLVKGEEMLGDGREFGRNAFAESGRELIGACESK
jgi:Pyruvate/2-oxoacid:ferredoxin oxidoreductase delta subunit